MMKWKRTTFDIWVGWCFEEYLETKNNFKNVDSKSLEKGIMFNLLELQNKSSLVSDDLWKQILVRHFQDTNYN